MMSFLVPPMLSAGDRVRLVSPASTPSRSEVDATITALTRLGLVVEVGTHVFDEHGYLAGRDEDRIADVNDALNDPGVRAVIATRGGKGAYRIADRLDVDAVRRDPKLVVGFSEITIIHLWFMARCGLVGLHGAAWNAEVHGQQAASSFEEACFTTELVDVSADPSEATAALTTTGRVSGRLIGGNQDLLAIASGWALPSLDDAILLLEAVNLRLGHIDRQLTMLMNSGALRNVVGVAVGHYTDCGPDATTQGDWTRSTCSATASTSWTFPFSAGSPSAMANNREQFRSALWPLSTPMADHSSSNPPSGE